MTFPTCYITPMVTWDYRHPNNQSSGIDCIADFSFPSGFNDIRTKFLRKVTVIIRNLY